LQDSVTQGKSKSQARNFVKLTPEIRQTLRGQAKPIRDLLEELISRDFPTHDGRRKGFVFATRSQLAKVLGRTPETITNILTKAPKKGYIYRMFPPRPKGRGSKPNCILAIFINYDRLSGANTPQAFENHVRNVLEQTWRKAKEKPYAILNKLVWKSPDPLAVEVRKKLAAEQRRREQPHVRDRESSVVASRAFESHHQLGELDHQVGGAIQEEQAEPNGNGTHPKQKITTSYSNNSPNSYKAHFRETRLRSYKNPIFKRQHRDKKGIAISTTASREKERPRFEQAIRANNQRLRILPVPQLR
jgi:hypothetical protein